MSLGDRLGSSFCYVQLVLQVESFYLHSYEKRNFSPSFSLSLSPWSPNMPKSQVCLFCYLCFQKFCVRGEVLLSTSQNLAEMNLNLLILRHWQLLSIL